MRALTDFPDAALRLFDRPPLPPRDQIADVYLIGICGKAMGALAELAQEAGYAVRGADHAAYPPMSTRLQAVGIPVLEGFDPAHLDPPPDLVVVGNACTPTHLEAAYARDQRLVQASLPEALAHLFLAERRPLVVAGTHGKTTTTGLAIHVFQQAGCDPGFLVGGELVGSGRTAALGSGKPFVIEGDEYDTAYFDKRPKFWLYRPASAIVTSLEFDHADIYADWDDYRAAFEHFVGLLPPDGTLVLHADDAAVRALAGHTQAQVRLYGDAPEAHVRATDVTLVDGGQQFTVVVDGVAIGAAFLPLGGAYNRMNALAVVALALAEGVPADRVLPALATFQGMKRRQEVVADVGGVLLVDDYAHHPTAVEVTLRGVRERWPGRRLLVAFEPRSNSSRRKLFEARYGTAFDAADRVFLTAPPLRHNDDPADFLDPRVVTQALIDRDVPATCYSHADALLPDLAAAARPGDLVVVMSNGSFDGLLARLQTALAARD